MDKLLKILLLTAFLNALSWIVLTPLWQYPDEQAHFAQVQDVAEAGYVPLAGNDTSQEIALAEKIMGTVRDSIGNNNYTYHPEYKINYSQTLYGPAEKEISNLPKSARKEFVKDESTLNPPLYYRLASLTYKIFSWADLFTRVFTVRMLSLVFFLSTLFLTYKISQKVFEKSQIMPIIISSAVAFTPMFAYVSSGLFPDPLVNFLFTVVIYLSILVVESGLKIKTIALLIATILLGILTRQQFFIAVFISITAIVFYLLKDPKHFKKIFPIGAALALIGSALFLSGQFSLKKFILTPEIGVPNFLKLFSSDFLLYLREFIRFSVAQTLPWYWGVYKWLSLTLPHINYQIINRFLLISLVGLAIYILKIVRLRKFNHQDRLLFFLTIITFAYFAIFAIWDYFFRELYNYSFGFQGRYFFPLISAHFILLLTGQNTVVKIVFGKFSKYYLYILVFLMFIFNLLTITYVSASYYDTSSLHSFIIQASQYKPEIFKGTYLFTILTASIFAQAIYLLTLFKYVHETSET